MHVPAKVRDILHVTQYELKIRSLGAGIVSVEDIPCCSPLFAVVGQHGAQRRGSAQYHVAGLRSAMRVFFFLEINHDVEFSDSTPRSRAIRVLTVTSYAGEARIQNTHVILLMRWRTMAVKIRNCNC